MLCTRKGLKTKQILLINQSITLPGGERGRWAWGQLDVGRPRGVSRAVP